MPKYKVTLCYSTYRTVDVEAANMAAALVEADKKPPGPYDKAEIIANLARWSEGDDVVICKSENKSEV
ncbi:MAG: hypothetical protein C4542_05195 [Dehalococcoidia bacterium]|nr:MAG: hypothetical protein C4542_05195 [Dehalococcoidia bacterium]